MMTVCNVTSISDSADVLVIKVMSMQHLLFLLLCYMFRYAASYQVRAVLQDCNQGSSPLQYRPPCTAVVPTSDQYCNEDLQI